MLQWSAGSAAQRSPLGIQGVSCGTPRSEALRPASRSVGVRPLYSGLGPLRRLNPLRHVRGETS